MNATESKIRDLSKRIAGGVLPAMATPLREEGYEVKVEAIKPLVDFLSGAGVKGLFVGGTTGEGILLEAGQRRILHEQTMASANGRLPVILHVGANNTREAAALAEHAASLGADAIAAVTPFYYPIHDDALLDYYQTVAAAAPETPLLLYDIPQMAVNGIGARLLPRLAEALPTLAGIKSSQPDAQKLRQLLDAAPQGIDLLAGNERIALGSLALGAHGLISGLATAVPEPFVKLTAHYAAGEWAEARAWQRRLNQMLDLLPAGARIGALKRILQQRGLDVGPAVPPRPTPSELDLWGPISSLLS